jgi:beta-lactam-binding protein with PASTA domain
MKTENIKKKLKAFLNKKFIRFFYSKTFILNLFILGVVSAILVFLTIKSLSSYTNHGQKIEVPSLSKKSLQEAETILKKLNLRSAITDSTIYKPDFPKKSVTGQNPKAGDFVKENRKIYLNINAWGYRNIEIPRFYGKTKRRVISELEARGFKINQIEESVPDIALDIVRDIQFKEESINAGDKLPKTSELTLFVGDGNGRTRYLKPSEND